MFLICCGCLGEKDQDDMIQIRPDEWICGPCRKMEFFRCSVCTTVVPGPMRDSHFEWHGWDELWCAGTNPIAHYQGDCDYCSLNQGIFFAETQPDEWRIMPWKCSCGQGIPHEWKPACWGQFTPRIVLEFAG